MNSDRFITRQEAAQMLDIGLRTLDWQRSRMRGPVAHYVRLDGRRRLLYRRRDVERYRARRDRARKQASWDAEAARRLRTAIRLHARKRLIQRELEALMAAHEMQIREALQQPAPRKPSPDDSQRRCNSRVRGGRHGSARQRCTGEGARA